VLAIERAPMFDFRSGRR